MWSEADEQRVRAAGDSHDWLGERLFRRESAAPSKDEWWLGAADSLAVGRIRWRKKCSTSDQFAHEKPNISRISSVHPEFAAAAGHSLTIASAAS